MVGVTFCNRNYTAFGYSRHLFAKTSADLVYLGFRAASLLPWLYVGAFIVAISLLVPLIYWFINKVIALLPCLGPTVFFLLCFVPLVILIYSPDRIAVAASERYVLSIKAEFAALCGQGSKRCPEYVSGSQHRRGILVAMDDKHLLLFEGAKTARLVAIDDHELVTRIDVDWTQG